MGDMGGDFRALKVKLESFLSFERGWDSYDALPISERVVQKAKEFVDRLPAGSWHVTPTATGGVQFDLHEDGIDVELYISEAL